MRCTICGSEDTRRSHRRTIYSFIARWQGLRRFRCRECQSSFYRPLSYAERPELSALIDRPVNSAGANDKRRKRPRRLLEVLLFVGMLAIFYAAFAILTRSS